jgi:hypothetical protein
MPPDVAHTLLRPRGQTQLMPAGAVTLAELGKNVINSLHCFLPPSTCQRNLCYCIYISLNSWVYILQESRQIGGRNKIHSFMKYMEINQCS